MNKISENHIYTIVCSNVPPPPTLSGLFRGNGGKSRDFLVGKSSTSMGVPVWNPYLKKDIEKLENIQHRATRLAPSLRKFITSGVKFLNGGQIYFIGGQILETFFYNQKLSLFQFNKWLHNKRGCII